MLEIWKSYPEDERYQISTHGRVIGVKGDILKLQSGTGGLKHFHTVRRDENGVKIVKAVSVSRAVLKTFVGPPPEEDWFAAHKNKVSDDNYLENLEWQTQEQVQRETTAMGCHGKGSEKAGAILNEESVREIRDWWECDASIAWIAEMYGVSEATISNVVNRKSWKHVHEDDN